MMNKIIVGAVFAATVLGAVTVQAAGPHKPTTAAKARLDLAIANGEVVMPNAGGTCPAPTNFTASPYNDSGSTAAASNIVGTLRSGCSSYSTVAGPDVVYSFTAGSSANLTFTVTPEGSYDTAIYLLSTCATGTGASCISGADAGVDGDAESFSVSTLTAGTTYYLHVDSYWSATDPDYGAYSSGAYTLAVTGTLPVQLQSFDID